MEILYTLTSHKTFTEFFLTILKPAMRHCDLQLQKNFFVDFWTKSCILIGVDGETRC